MRTDGLFIIHNVTIPVKIGKPVFLLPLGDIHHDSKAHAGDVFNEWLSYVAKERRGAHVLGMGDFLDFMRAHTRAMVAADASAGAKEIEDTLMAGAIENVATLHAKLKRLPVTWIGLLGGNHYMEIAEKVGGIETREHSEARMARLLGAPYLGVCCALTLTLMDSKAKVGAEVRIIAHHGVGGATTIGGSLNRVQRFLSGWEADIALMGDDHKRGVCPIGDKLSAVRHLSRNMLSSRTQWVGRTGSFLRGFVDGESGYVTDMALTPSALGTIEIELRLKISPQTGKPMVAIRMIQ